MKLKAFILTFIILTNSSTSFKKASSPCFESIISFGDSLADTGNYVVLEGPSNPPASALQPYGRTFFHHPTGRFSDGRLIIDFLAENLGLPHVQPYLNGSSGRFEKGVNFAVAGAVALDVQYFEERGYDIMNTNVTLGVQFNWFKHFLATIPDNRKYLQDSLIVLGEIGRNDYCYPLLQGKSVEVAMTIVGDVINKIRITIEELINLGARTILVPGTIPNGCLPSYLTEFRTSNMKDYDPKTGCINWLDELSKYHNGLLERELSRLGKTHPYVNIIYGDYYNCPMRFYVSPNDFGFKREILKACCGPVWLYNSPKCGQAAKCCNEPSSFASWDGVHYTEAAYNFIANSIIEDHFSTICTSISSHSKF